MSNCPENAPLGVIARPVVWAEAIPCIVESCEAVAQLQASDFAHRHDM
jgi:hypothetical protein